MPWESVTVSEEKERFLDDHRMNYYSVSELGESFNTSRDTTQPGLTTTPRGDWQVGSGFFDDWLKPDAHGRLLGGEAPSEAKTFRWGRVPTNPSSCMLRYAPRSKKGPSPPSSPRVLTPHRALPPFVISQHL